MNLDLFIEALRKKLFLFALCITFTVTVVMGLTFLQKPVYEANAKLLIDMETANVLNMNDIVKMGDTNYWSFREYLKSQCIILESRTLAKRVLNQLNLWDELSVPTFWDKIKSSLRPHLKLSSINLYGKKEDTGIEAQITIIDRFLKRLTVTHIRDTRVVQLTFEHNDPKTAQTILNTWIDQFIQQNLHRKVAASDQARKWLSEEKQRLNAILELKEFSIHEFRKANNFISVDERQDIINQSLNDLNQKLVETESLYAEYQKRYQMAHPKMAQLLERKETLSHLIKKRREEAIEFANTLVHFNNIQREIELNQKMLDSVLNREKELMMTSSLQDNNVSIIENPILPEKPIKPRKTLNFILSLIAGFMLAGTWIYLLEIMSTNIQNQSDLTEFGIPYLGSIPYISKSILKKKNYRDTYLILNRSGVISELFNHLRTSVLMKTKEKKDKLCQSILITSFRPGEGKSMISCNLSVGLAKYNFRVLLVEADLRRPRLAKAFDMENSNGLSEYLSGTDALETLVRPTTLKNLDLLSSGKIPENPSELIGNGRIESLLSEVQGLYDFILFDCPPVMSVTDPVILIKQVKNVLLITKYDDTPKKLLPIAKEKVASAGGNLLGCVINQVTDMKKSSDLEYMNSYYQGANP